MKNLLNNLKPYQVTPEEHQLRSRRHLNSGQLFKKSVEETDLKSFPNVFVGIPKDIPSASDPLWANVTFGAVNTAEKSACVVFISKIILNEYGYNSISVLNLLNEAAQKGYRSWTLSNKRKTLTAPVATIDVFKKAFPDDEYIQSCTTLKEIYDKYGRPEGIGGSMFFIDNIIKLLSNDENLRIGNDTRIQSIQQLLDNLKSGIMVPVRVENSIYHDTPFRTGGHYVVLVGFINQYALVVDTSFENGINIVPAKRFVNAIVGNHDDLICAWNLKPCCR